MSDRQGVCMCVAGEVLQASFGEGTARVRHIIGRMEDLRRSQRQFTSGFSCKIDQAPRKMLPVNCYS